MFKDTELSMNLNSVFGVFWGEGEQVKMVFLPFQPLSEVYAKFAKAEYQMLTKCRED